MQDNVRMTIEEKSQDWKPFDVSIVTVTYNECENIGLLIDELRRIFLTTELNGEIIIVDDNSPDGTPEIVARLTEGMKSLKLIKRTGRLGIGSAYADGLRAAKGRILITMDADFSHPPSALPALIGSAESGAIAIGSRFVQNSRFSTQSHRKLAALLTNFAAKTFLRTGVYEHTNGYLAITRKHLHAILKRSKELGIDPFSGIHYGTSIIAIGERLGIPAVEIPAPYQFRKLGISKIGLIGGLGHLIAHLLYIMKLWRALRNAR